MVALVQETPPFFRVPITILFLFNSFIEGAFMQIFQNSRLNKRRSFKNIAVGVSVAACMVCMFVLTSTTAKAQSICSGLTCSSIEIRNCTPYVVDFFITYCDGYGNIVQALKQIDMNKCNPATTYNVPGVILDVKLTNTPPPPPGVGVNYDLANCSAIFFP